MVVDRDNKLESFDDHEYRCPDSELVDIFIEYAKKEGIDLSPFDVNRINLSIIDESFEKTIRNLQYEIRNIKLNNLIDE